MERVNSNNYYTCGMPVPKEDSPSVSKIVKEVAKRIHAEAARQEPAQKLSPRRVSSFNKKK